MTFKNDEYAAMLTHCQLTYYKVQRVVDYKCSPSCSGGSLQQTWEIFFQFVKQWTLYLKKGSIQKKDVIRQEIEIHTESLFEEQETWSKFEGFQTSIARIAIKEHFYMGESGWYRNRNNAITHDKFIYKVSQEKKSN